MTVSANPTTKIFRESHNILISGGSRTLLIEANLFNEIRMPLPRTSVRRVPPALDVEHCQRDISSFGISYQIHFAFTVMVSAEFANHLVARKLSIVIYHGSLEHSDISYCCSTKSLQQYGTAC